MLCGTHRFWLCPTAIALLTLAAGCAGRGAAPMAPGTFALPTATTSNAAATIHEFIPISHMGASRFAGSQAIGKGVFVADPSANAIEIFDPRTKALIGQIRGLGDPLGLAAGIVMGNARELFEADYVTQAIRVYDAPYTAPPKVLQDTGFYPSSLHGDRFGNLWVANICSGSSYSCLGPGNVVEYKNAEGKPVALAGAPPRMYFVTTDAEGNVWADGVDASLNGVIGYWKNGSGSFKSVDIPLMFPGGLQFDRSGNLLIDDQDGAPNGGSVIKVYPPMSTVLSRTITVQTNGDDVVSFAFGANGRLIYAPQFQAGITEIISYASGKVVGKLPSTGTPDAVAVIPGATP